MTTKEGRALMLEYSKNNFWVYAGGFGPTPRHRNYFNLRWPGRVNNPPKHKKKCICEHAIQENCYIFNTETKKIKVIGNCCIDKFDLGGRTCGQCGAIHKNRKDNYCNDCRKVRARTAKANSRQRHYLNRRPNQN
tara:strand:+ start:613 stop:1017 length:405 start_codon:yes stop_codon:yes gene_type:complete